MQNLIRLMVKPTLNKLVWIFVYTSNINKKETLYKEALYFAMWIQKHGILKLYLRFYELFYTFKIILSHMKNILVNFPSDFLLEKVYSSKC